MPHSSAGCWEFTCETCGAQHESDIDGHTHWQGSSSGQFLCVVDDNYGSSAGDADTGFSHATILEASTGITMHQFSSRGTVGKAIWSEQGDVCLLQDCQVIVTHQQQAFLSLARRPTALRAQAGANFPCLMHVNPSACQVQAPTLRVAHSCHSPFPRVAALWWVPCTAKHAQQESARKIQQKRTPFFDCDTGI